MLIDIRYIHYILQLINYLLQPAIGQGRVECGGVPLVPSLRGQQCHLTREGKREINKKREKMKTFHLILLILKNRYFLESKIPSLTLDVGVWKPISLFLSWRRMRTWTSRWLTTSSTPATTPTSTVTRLQVPISNNQQLDLICKSSVLETSGHTCRKPGILGSGNPEI